MTNAAAALIGAYGKGSPEVYAIWRDVLPDGWPNSEVTKYAATREWCGGFALNCLHRAGLALDVFWHDGIGFIGPAKLRRLPHDAHPLPGDIAVKNLPFAHHMVVEYFNHDLDWGDIAGNTPHVARHSHHNRAGVDFYSIASLLPALTSDPAPAPHHGVLRIGSTGVEVLELQRAVGATPDGSFGPQTQRALQEWQRKHGLDADGICGALTWDAILKAHGT